MCGVWSMVDLFPLALLSLIPVSFRTATRITVLLSGFILSHWMCRTVIINSVVVAKSSVEFIMLRDPW